MGISCPFLRGASFWAGSLSVVGVLGGCASPNPGQAYYEGQTSRVLFPDATLNGQPAHFMLDTGAGLSMLSEEAASHFSLKSSVLPPGYVVQTWENADALNLSEPVQLTFASGEFTTPLPIQTGEKPDSEKIDGVIGWPELRDDLLLFDGPRHTVSALTALPPETASWLKLKVRPGSLLILETPQTNGNTDWIYVDTGSPFGVGLGPRHWAAWWKAEPRAKVYAGLAGSTHGAESWADQVSVGPLTLNQVPIFEEDATGMWAKDDEPAAVLGLGALSRMLMIVDRKSNLAYLQPVSAEQSQTTTPATAATNWTVASNVRLTMAPLLAFSSGGQAMSAFLKGDYPAAIADFTTITGRDSSDSDAFCFRGYAKLALDDLPGALADFNQTIALDPTNADAFYHRAATEQIQGNYTRAIADYDKVIALQPDDSYRPRLLRQLLLLQLGLPTGAFSQTIAGWKDDWRKALGRFITGTLEQADFLQEAAKTGDATHQELEAYYYAGVVRLLHGDASGARNFWERCLKTNDSAYYVEYHPLARAELAKLGDFGEK